MGRVFRVRKRMDMVQGEIGNCMCFVKHAVFAFCTIVSLKIEKLSHACLSYIYLAHVCEISTRFTNDFFNENVKKQVAPQKLSEISK